MKSYVHIPNIKIETHQKYTFVVSTKTPQTSFFTAEVSHIYDRSWKTVFSRSSRDP